MRPVGPPRPWRTVPVGAVVLCTDGTPRTVLVNDPAWLNAPFSGPINVLLEGMAPLRMTGDAPAQVVELDETDAMLAMFAVGLEPVVLSVTDARES